MQGGADVKILHELNDVLMIFNPEFECHPDKVGFFHWHENAEFLYILEDGFKILIDGVMHEPKKGDIIFIGEYSVHCFICEKFMHMALGQFALPLLLDGYTDIKPIKTHITAEEIAEDAVFSERIMHLLEVMKTMSMVNKNDKNPFAKSVFSAFYYALMEKFPETKSSENSNKERKEFYKIIEFINDNITSDITTMSISKSLYIDRGKLSKIFSKYSGMPLNDYINKLRVSKANELFEKGSSVTEAALESGFQSVRTFNNVYKELMGITPSQYINKKGRI